MEFRRSSSVISTRVPALDERGENLLEADVKADGRELQGAVAGSGHRSALLPPDQIDQRAMRIATPFGRPVLPLVNRTYARSEGVAGHFPGEFRSPREIRSSTTSVRAGDPGTDVRAPAPSGSPGTAVLHHRGEAFRRIRRIHGDIGGTRLENAQDALDQPGRTVQADSTVAPRPTPQCHKAPQRSGCIPPRSSP